MERLFDRIPAFAGMTAHTNNRKLRSIEDSLKLALMGLRGGEDPPSPNLSLQGRGNKERGNRGERPFSPRVVAKLTVQGKGEEEIHPHPTSPLRGREKVSLPRWEGVRGRGVL